jgi:hypothetical protein
MMTPENLMARLHRKMTMNATPNGKGREAVERDHVHGLVELDCQAEHIPCPHGGDADDGAGKGLFQIGSADPLAHAEDGRAGHGQHGRGGVPVTEAMKT